MGVEINPKYRNGKEAWRGLGSDTEPGAFSAGCGRLVLSLVLLFCGERERQEKSTRGELWAVKTK